MSSSHLSSPNHRVTPPKVAYPEGDGRMGVGASTGPMNGNQTPVMENVVRIDGAGHRMDDRPEPGKWKAMALAVFMHAVLIVILVFGISWQNPAPEPVAVEVWSSAPPPPPAPDHAPTPDHSPAPRPPEPKPEVQEQPPVKPDIALREDKKKPEPKKPEPKPEVKKPESKPEPKKPEIKPEPKKPEPKPDVRPEPKPTFDEALKREMDALKREQSLRDSQRRADQEARQLAQLKADAAAAGKVKAVAGYADKIRAKVRGNVVLPPAVSGNPEAIFEVVQLPSGEVLSVRLKRSSGISSLDGAIERAILKSSPLPKPDDPALFQRVLELKYKPFDE